mmetsp:Transcript_8049/g.20005  ORF Transcript_8049/g.20005 Transcript_8049/m.20005 type:complete len:81 (-) Transcript_8049:215-457(-)
MVRRRLEGHAWQADAEAFGRSHHEAGADSTRERDFTQIGKGRLAGLRLRLVPPQNLHNDVAFRAQPHTCQTHECFADNSA